MVSLVQQTRLLSAIAYAVSVTAVQSISLLTHKVCSCEQRWRNTSIQWDEIDQWGDFDQITRAHFATIHNSISEPVCGM